jgi:hypothetical protein
VREIVNWACMPRTYSTTPPVFGRRFVVAAQLSTREAHQILAAMSVTPGDGLRRRASRLTGPLFVRTQAIPGALSSSARSQPNCLFEDAERLSRMVIGTVASPNVVSRQ